MAQNSLARHRGVGATAVRAVERALAELRRGEVVWLSGPDGGALAVLAAESAGPCDPGRIATIAGGAPRLLLTATRAAWLGLNVVEAEPGHTGIVALELDPGLRLDVASLANPCSGRPIPAGNLASFPLRTTDFLETAAVDLVKLARLLPAAIVVPIEAPNGEAGSSTHQPVRVSLGQIEAYRDGGGQSVVAVAEARVPLEDAAEARIIAFRPGDGGAENLAIVVAQPERPGPVLVRLHSECFTGDLLASLRCDCGDQLRGAIRAISDAGAGILLYLAQEGRGIGLVNKLRAYALQDRGADTVDANRQLGFEADERVYRPASLILRELGYSRVRLMTNNPDKLAALARFGISVEERVAHAFPSNGHNEPYLSTKADRFGHLL